MGHARIRLLGRFEAGGTSLPSGKRSQLLAYLACAGDWVSRERLADLFWPDVDAGASRRNLRQLVSRVRQLNGAKGLELEKERIRWSVDCDVALLREAARRDDWRTVAALYGGDLLAGHEPDGSGGFDAWLDLERDELRTLHRRAVLAVARELAAAGDHARAADSLEPFANAQEPDEEALNAFMEQAYLAGQRDRALRAFRAFESMLEAEYGLGPLDATISLAGTIGGSEPLDVAAMTARRRDRTVPLAVLRPPRMIDRSTLAARVVASRAGMVLIRGEAGTGKTRLLQELGPGATWLSCLEGTKPVPYRALSALISRLVPVHGTPAGLKEYAGDLARLVPEIMPGESPPALAPEEAGPRLREALVRYLTEEAGDADAPFQLVADDLQWADPATLQVLAEVVARGGLRILGAYRRHEATPELRELQSQPGVETHALDEFGPDALRVLLADLSGRADIPAAFSDWLYAATGGNARFVLEILQHLFETGILDESVVGWHEDLASVPALLAPGHLPRSAGQLIGRRTARLGPAARRVLHGAAVLADATDPELLALLAGCNEDDALLALEGIEEAGLTTDGAFPHDVVREAVYQAILPARRRSLHGRAGQVLATRSQHLQAAGHLFEAGQSVPAINQLMAGISALRLTGLYDQALAVVTSTLTRRAGDLTDEARLALLGEHAALLRGLARLDEAWELAREVVDLSSVPLTLTASFATLSSIALQRGASEEAELLARDALREARRAGDRWHEQNALSSLGIAHHFRGRTEEALATFRQLLVEVRETGPDIDVAAQLSSCAVLLDQLGRPREALPLHEEAVSIATRLGARRQQVDHTLNLVCCREDLKTLDEELLQQVVNTLALGRFEGTDSLRYTYGRALSAMGREDEARAQWLQVTQDSRDPTLLLMTWSKLARADEASSDPESVRAALEQVRLLAPRTDLPEALAAAAITLFDAGDEPNGRSLLTRSGYTKESLPPHLSALRQRLDA
mgnify:CR=1 FL=1